jgi:serine/threonine protein phosphatase PrpC
MITCKPDITEIVRQPDDEFIIMGCDGIWEKYVNDSQPLVTRIGNERKTGNENTTILKSLLDYLVAAESNE